MSRSSLGAKLVHEVIAAATELYAAEKKALDGCPTSRSVENLNMPEKRKYERTKKILLSYIKTLEDL